MSKPSAADRLFALWREVKHLASASAVLEWDQETYMPSGGQVGRGATLASLAGLRHQKLTSSELIEALEAAAEEAEEGSALAAQVREGRRLVGRAARVPEKLARALAEATSAGLATWQEARRKSDFSLFQPALERILALRLEQAAAIDSSRPAYGVLMDEFEPGATEQALVPVFDQLRAALAPLIRTVHENGREIDESPARGAFPAAAQRRFGLFVAERMGFDFERGRLDATTHPFCTSFHKDDVRITWRWQEDDFRPALFGIMHEAGHGLYEQGLPGEWEGTPIGEAVSLGVHESQSRLWENLVGRSRSFWRWAMPHFREHFPGLPAFEVEELWPALHTARPSLIRVEADEATYNLHIALRFEIERRLVAAELPVSELPEVWDDAYQELLGIRPKNAAEGVLQDIHWGMGAIGYFPTYTLGNLINAQLFEAAERELGDLDPAFEEGEFAPLLGWLRDKIHRHGSFYPAGELVQRATGEPVGAGAFLRRITRVSEEAYGVALRSA